MNACFVTPTDFRQCLKDTRIRLEAIDFIEGVVRPLEDNDNYLAACKGGRFTITTEVLAELSERFDPFIREGRPGHDFGHNRRDFLVAAALVASDKTFNHLVYEADVAAGLLAAWLHDIATSVGPRYQDTTWECGHAEIGAFIFWQLTEDLLPEYLRQLAAYAIAAHTHYLKPVDIKTPVKYGQGWQRKPWEDEIFLAGNNDFPGEMAPPLAVRRSVQLARFADRVDANGVSHFARHVLAMADAYETEGGGADRTGGEFFEINHVTLGLVLANMVRSERPKPPTTLEHMLTFSDSNFGNTPFSVNDTDVMTEFMAYRQAQIHQFVRVATSSYDGTGGIIDQEAAWGRFAGFLNRVSQSPYLDGSLAVLRLVWNELDCFQQSKWAEAIEYAENAYGESLLWLQDKILHGDYADQRNTVIQRFALHAMADVW